MLVKHISERPIPVQQRRAGMPEDLARAVMLLLEKDPANRFPSASALVAALDTGNVPMPTARTSGGIGPSIFTPGGDSYASSTGRGQASRAGGDMGYAPVPYDD